MKHRLWLAACALAGNACGPAALAQPAEPAPTLSAAVESAWQRAVLARETEGQRQLAAAQRQAARSLWAAPPAVEINHLDDRLQTAAGRRETELALAWPLWLPGQRAARRATADAGSALAQIAHGAARLRITGEVREAAWAVLSHEAEVAQATAVQQSLQLLHADVDRRVRAGDLARADALASQAEERAAVAQQSAAGQRLLAARSRWALLTGLQAVPAAGEPAAEGSVAEHPELLLALQHTELARRRLEQVQATRREPPELLLRYRQEVPGRAEATQNSIGIGLRLAFGTADRNEPLLAAALSELDVARASEQQLRARLAADLTEARAAQLAAAQQLAAERERAALLRERAQLIDKSFNAGESPLPELLGALAAAAQADAAAAGQQTALGLARSRLRQTLGLLP